ncbi:MAG: hypothetical protein ACREJC_20445 [Tepidisphaeraceae bacterium]
MSRWKDLPVTHFDRIGPQSRPGVTRHGLFRENLIVRTNPIGAVIDWFRGLCVPLPQEEVSDGEFAADGGLGTNVAPEDYAPYGQSVGGSLEPLYTPTDLARPAAAEPAAVSVVESLSQTRAALAAAKLSRDCEGVRSVLDVARQQRGDRRSTNYASWQTIAIDAKAWLMRNQRLCR